MARVLISMKDEFLDKVDEVATTEQRSRSELIREALRYYMRRSVLGASSVRAEDDAKSLETILFE